MWVLKRRMSSFVVSLIGWKAAPPRAVAVQGRVDSNSDWSRGSHSSDGLAVGRSCSARGPERRASHAVGASLVAQAVPAAGSRVPFSRNFKSVPARAVRRWPRPFPRLPLGLPALMPRLLLGAGLWVRRQPGTRLMPCFWLNHLRETPTVTPPKKQSKQILCLLVFCAEKNYNNALTLKRGLLWQLIIDFSMVFLWSY